MHKIHNSNQEGGELMELGGIISYSKVGIHLISLGKPEMDELIYSSNAVPFCESKGKETSSVQAWGGSRSDGQKNCFAF